MNLRNKKTGETGYYLHTHRDHNTGTLKVAVLKDGVPFSEFKPHEPIYDYDSLTELNDEWEDYVPKEPLIKDEKIRKAVRAWAEANEISQAQFDRYTSGFSASDDGHNILSMISFDGFVFMFVDGKYYTIDELCGEEEE